LEFRGSRHLGVASVVAVFVVLVLGAGFLPAVQARNIPTQTPIKHVIVIVQENHTFFNYFGDFPGVEGGVSDAICMPRDALNFSCQKAFETNDPISTGKLSTDGYAAQMAFDNGSMDRFLIANGDNPNIMSYYNATVLPFYWGLAEHYTLFDQFFSSYMSYSLPNHWAALAGLSPPIAIQSRQDIYSNASATELIQQASIITTMLELIHKYPDISTKYYDERVNYSSLTQAIEQGGDNYIVNFWNPSLVKADTYTTLRSDFVQRTQILKNVADGKLPAVSWVIPNKDTSEHPPDNITLGEHWVQSVVDAVMNSKYWSSTAIFLVTDDWGGFYDPIVPPVFDGQRLGFRISAMLISPYAAAGIDSTQFSFESILHFIAYNWNLNISAISSRVADSNNLLGAFNFSQRPLQPWTGTPLTPAQLQNITAWANQDTPDID